MRKSFYGSLALNNVKKNAKGYVPYMLTCIISIMIFYIMAAIVYNPDVTKMFGGTTLRSLLQFGMWVVGIFSAIFLFYTNSFLIKQRKKELALYNILGMAKRHIGKVMLLETLFVSAVSLIIGLIAGMVFGKLFFLLLLRILVVELPMGYQISTDGALLTTVLFGAIFLVVLLCNLGRISLANPIQLMAGSRQGEKEPKTKWLLVLLGLGMTGAGYYMAITVVSPIQALGVFFAATILVIGGTYLLFTAGSIALLKMLKKKKSFYYKTEHFTAVSGMLYRMKRNAAGLASICILSTMVLVTISTTVSMQVGISDILDRQVPYDIQARSQKPLTDNKAAELENQFETILSRYGAEHGKVVSYPCVAAYGEEQGNRVIPIDTFSVDKELVQIYLVPMEGSRLEKDYGSLAEDEIIIGGEREVDSETFGIGSMEFRVKDGASDFKTAAELGTIAIPYYILVKDQQVVDEIRNTAKEAFSEETYFTGVDLDIQSNSKTRAIADTLSEETGRSIYIENRETSAMELHSVYGGLLFVGIFLGLLFTIATVLMIYYMQITEGYEDSENYHIMQKVGMSLAEVKRSIRSQILIVFFLPLIAAIFHVAAAFNMMSRLLIAIQITNVWLFVGATAATILAFAVIYIVVYSLTAREYYKLVK